MDPRKRFATILGTLSSGLQHLVVFAPSFCTAFFDTRSVFDKHININHKLAVSDSDATTRGAVVHERESHRYLAATSVLTTYTRLQNPSNAFIVYTRFAYYRLNHHSCLVLMRSGRTRK